MSLCHSVLFRVALSALDGTLRLWEGLVGLLLLACVKIEADTLELCAGRVEAAAGPRLSVSKGSHADAVWKVRPKVAETAQREHRMPGDCWRS